MDCVVVHAGSVARRHDRRLDNAKRSSTGSTRDIPALSGGLDLNGRCAVRGTGVRHQFYRRSVLLGHHYGGSGRKIKIRSCLCK